MNKTTSFNRHSTNHRDLVELHNSGWRIICPMCESELIFQKSGVWCPKNDDHYSVHNYSADIARNTRESSRQRGIAKTVTALEAKGYSQSQIRAEILKYYPEVEFSSKSTKDSQTRTVRIAKAAYPKRKRSTSRTRIATVRRFRAYKPAPKLRSERTQSKDLIQ